MPNRARFAVTGCKEIDRSLRALGPKIANGVVKTALRDACKSELAPEVQRLAPEGSTHRLAGAVKVRAGKRSRRGISVTVLIDVASLGAQSFYAAFRELGTAKMAAAGFMRAALASKGPAALARAVDSIRRGIDDAVRTSRT